VDIIVQWHECIKKWKYSCKQRNSVGSSCLSCTTSCSTAEVRCRERTWRW